MHCLMISFIIAELNDRNGGNHEAAEMVCTDQGQVLVRSMLLFSSEGNNQILTLMLLR